MKSNLSEKLCLAVLRLLLLILLMAVTTGSVSAINVSLSVSAETVCGPEITHRLEVAWEVTDIPSVNVEIQIVAALPDGTTHTSTHSGAQGTTTLDLTLPDGGTVVMNLTAVAATGAATDASETALLPACDVQPPANGDEEGELLHSLEDLLHNFEWLITQQPEPDPELLKSYEDLLHGFDQLLQQQQQEQGALEKDLLLSLECLLHSFEYELDRYLGPGVAELPEPTFTDAADPADILEFSTPLLGPACDTQECCPAGLETLLGTDEQDLLISHEPNQCLVLLDEADVGVQTATSRGAILGGLGDDVIRGACGPNVLAGGLGDDTLLARHYDDELYGNTGNDEIVGHEGDDFVSGGRGADTIDGGPGADTLFGNLGDDQILGQYGSDIIVPGPGRDQVLAGPGDDTVVVYDVCELAEDEELRGGSGEDRLILPAPLADVQALGVTVAEFETIEVVTTQTQYSECQLCSCSLEDGQLNCCHGQGICSEIAADNTLQCECNDDFIGPDCGFQPTQTVYEADQIPGCEPNDPTCHSLVSAIDEELNINLNLTDICDDLPGALDQAFGVDGNGDGVLNALMFHPVDEDEAWTDGPFPLALFVHGQGHEYIYYQDLMSHLAKNNIVAVSIEAANNFQVAQRADLHVCYLRYMRHEWPLNNKLMKPPRVAFLGHSRGGEAAAFAANRRKQKEVEGNDLDSGVENMIVASLAPSANCLGSETACIPDGSAYQDLVPQFAGLLDESASAFMVLQGTRDGDVPGQGLTLYEEASAEGPDPAPDDMTKNVTWVYDVPHNNWGGKGFAPEDKALSLARAYIGGFLSWWLHDETDNRDFFTGTSIPACIAQPSMCTYDFEAPELFSIYREGAAGEVTRRVVHDFEGQPNLSPSKLGAVSVSPSDAATLVDLSLFNPPHSGFIPTRGMHVQFNDDPAAVQFEFSSPEDVTDFSFLSIRFSKPAAKVPGAGEENCAPHNTDELNADVTLRDNAGGSHEVEIRDFARVPVPDFYYGVFAGGPGALVQCNAVDFLRTVRIPLSLFTSNGVDLSSLESLELSFTAMDNPALPREAIVDSIEFTRNDLDAVCGNGIVEIGEECDGNALGGQDCSDFGFSGGSLSCTDSCTFDTSACGTCGDGIVSGGEECDDGNQDPFDDCSPECTLCPAGDEFCRCLGSEPGEANPDLPGGGVLGTGLYCNDDVVFGGGSRCVETSSGTFGCIDCNINQGPWCPCFEGDQCFRDFDGFDVINPAPIGATWTCSFAHTEDSTQPALGHGYCFAEGEDPENGGMPSWFFNQYCENFDPQATHQFTPEEGDVCVLP